MWIQRGVKGRLHGGLCSLPVPELPELRTLALSAFAMTCSVSYSKTASGKSGPIHWEALMGWLAGFNLCNGTSHKSITSTLGTVIFLR